MHEKIGGGGWGERMVLMHGSPPGTKLGMVICGARRSVHKEDHPVSVGVFHQYLDASYGRECWRVLARRFSG